MNKNYSDITVVLDRSGSMISTKLDTIGGYNSFIAEQKKQPGEAKLTLIQFDDKYEVWLNAVDIRLVGQLTEGTYVPRGSTALLDAIGKAVTSAGERFRNMPEANRPGQVLFVIITDGHENASQEFRGEAGRKQIAEIVKHQQEKYNWNFTYLGANQDAITVGGGLGVAAASTLTYDSHSKVGVKNMWESVTASTNTMRSTGNYSAYSEEARKKAVEKDEDKVAKNNTGA